MILKAIKQTRHRGEFRNDVSVFVIELLLDCVDLVFDFVVFVFPCSSLPIKTALYVGSGKVVNLLYFGEYHYSTS